MTHEYYFGKVVNYRTWDDFMEQTSKGKVEQNYTPITDYGSKDLFGFNPNGDAIYINSDGIRHKGVWFDLNDKRIAVFRAKMVN